MDRTKSRPSLNEIADKVGVHPSHVSKILNGRPCRGELAIKIAEAMDITVDELYRDYIYRGTWGFR